MEIETVRLEDKKEYVITNTIVNKDTKYIYMVPLEEIQENREEFSTLLIRKLDKKEKNILALDTEEEYKMALNNLLNQKKK